MATRDLSSALSDRENNFDFLRFVLASMVILTHSYCILGTSMNSEPISILTNHQILTSEIAVDFFFVVSGFLVSMSWERCNRFGEFCFKRLIRIYPALIAAVFVTVVLCVLFATQNPLHFAHDRRTYTYLLRELLFLDGSFALLANLFWRNSLLAEIRRHVGSAYSSESRPLVQIPTPVSTADG